MPTARNHLAAAAVDGFFYAVSGRNGAGLQAANEVYSTTTQSWSSAAPIRTPRGGIASAAFNGRIYVFGGEGNDNNPSTGVFEEVEEYDPVANRWRALDPMPLPRHGIGAALVGESIFIPGGGPIEGFSQTDRNDAFRPPRSPLNIWNLR
jgi:N-acetylneuraminic acid mutarotase